MLTSFARQSFIRERYPLVDEYVDLDAQPETLSVPGCSIQPGAPSEFTGVDDLSKVAWTVYAPGHPDVNAGDYGRLSGQLYRVAGEPQRWPGVSRLTEHTVVILERWEAV